MPEGVQGGGSAQVVQQIESLLAQLAQEQPEPQVQQAIKGIQAQVEPLQQILGAQQAQNMQGGLQNPTGPPPAGGPGGAGAPPPGGSPGEGSELPPEPGGAMPPEHGGEPGGGGEHGHHTIEIQIKPGGPKTFAGAKKAAMATHRERGHFDPNTPAGETPSTPRTKNKAKAKA